MTSSTSQAVQGFLVFFPLIKRRIVQEGFKLKNCGVSTKGHPGQITFHITTGGREHTFVCPVESWRTQIAQMEEFVNGLERT